MGNLRRAEARQLSPTLRRATYRLPLLLKEVGRHASRRPCPSHSPDHASGGPRRTKSTCDGSVSIGRGWASGEAGQSHECAIRAQFEGHGPPCRPSEARGEAWKASLGDSWEPQKVNLVARCWTNRHVERGNEAYYFGSRRTNEERPESFPTVPYSLRNSHWKAVSTFRPFAGSP